MPSPSPAEDKNPEEKQQRGRPKGAPNVSAKTTTILSRCAKCGSTDRTVISTSSQPFAGIAPDGQPYSHIIRRRVRCDGCQQTRIDRAFAQKADALGLEDPEI